MDSPGWLTLANVIYVLLALFVLGTFLSGFFIIETARAGIVQRLGRFVRVAGPGLNFKLPWIESVVHIADLRVQQLPVKMETKTKDNVFVVLPISVQFAILPDHVADAYYKLANPAAQITAYVEQVVLGHVPKMNLDETFEKQNTIAEAVRAELEKDMQDFGYKIVSALVTDIVPDAKVRSAMNDINAAQREQVAAQARGEAEKTLKIKAAEAEARSKALQGEGIANQRKAIIDGLRESVETFRNAVEGATAQDVMSLVMVTQYLDTLKEIGAQAHSNTILIPHSPGALTDLQSQIRQAVTTGQLLSKAGGVAEAASAAAGGRPKA